MSDAMKKVPKRTKKMVSLRLDPELLDRIGKIATAEDRTVTNVIVRLLKQVLGS